MGDHAYGGVAAHSSLKAGGVSVTAKRGLVEAAHNITNGNTYNHKSDHFEIVAIVPKSAMPSSGYGKGFFDYLQKQLQAEFNDDKAKGGNSTNYYANRSFKCLTAAKIKDLAVYVEETTSGYWNVSIAFDNATVQNSNTINLVLDNAKKYIPYIASAPVTSGTNYWTGKTVPLKTTVPKIYGSLKVGQKMTTKVGTWTSGATLKYQWLADGKAITGATKSSFTLTKNEKGKKVSLKVTASKSGYTTTSKTSAATAKIAAGRISATVPTISGTLKVGKTLTAKTGKWTSGTTLKYQWYASGKPIKGATKSTYKLTKDQKSRAISVKVTGTKGGYITMAKTSKSTAKVK